MKIKYFILLLSMLSSKPIFSMQYIHYLEKLLVSMRRPAAQEVKPPLQKVKFISIGENPNITYVASQIIGAVKDPAIKGIILAINNSGGSSSVYTMLHDTIKKACAFKPIIGIVTNAYSAGYLIASATDYIIAHNCSGIGNIGAICEIIHYKAPRIQRQDGIHADITVDTFKAGEFKGLLNAYHGEFSEKERAYLQKGIESSYELFVSMVAEDRSLDKNNAHEWAEAKDFLAYEALKLGLIDKIGTMFDAEAKIAELIKTKTYPPYPDYKIQYLFSEDKAA